LRHVRHWVPERTATPLIFGSAIHKAMSVVWAATKEDISNSELTDLASMAFLKEWLLRGGATPEELITLTDIRNPMLADEIIEAYVDNYRESLKWIELLGDETPYAVTLGQYGDNEVYYVGRLDKLYRGTDLRVWVGEHKTSSMYAKEGVFRSTWLNSFSPNNQILGYSYAGYLTYGEAFQGVNIDGILVHKTHRGFKRLPIIHSFEFVDVWLQEVKGWAAQLIDSTEKLNQGGQVVECFPRNLSSCHHYAGCAYLDICRYLQPHPEEIEETPPGYTVEEWHPFDEADLEEVKKSG